MIRPIRRPIALNWPGSCESGLVSSWPHIIGVSVSATTAEVPIAATRVKPNSRNKRPTTSGMNRIGIRAATSATAIEITVKPIWRVPFTAASSGASPASTRRAIFSTMITESSMTKPTAIVTANSEMLSRLNPSA